MYLLKSRWRPKVHGACDVCGSITAKEQTWFNIRLSALFYHLFTGLLVIVTYTVIISIDAGKKGCNAQNTYSSYSCVVYVLALKAGRWWLSELKHAIHTKPRQMKSFWEGMIDFVYMYWAPESMRKISLVVRVLLVSGSGLQGGKKRKGHMWRQYKSTCIKEQLNCFH